MDEIKSRLINLILSRDFWNTLVIAIHATILLLRPDWFAVPNFPQWLSVMDGLFMLSVNILTRTATAKAANVSIRARLGEGR